MSNGVALGGEPNGLGSLADELADAWAEDEEDDEDHSYLPMDGKTDNFNGSAHDSQGQHSEHTRDSGIDVPSSPVQSLLINEISTPPKKATKSRHQRMRSQLSRSDSWHESSSDENVAISSELEARMAAIERFTHSVPDMDREGVDDAMASILVGLRDLGSQAGVENGATR